MVKIKGNRGITLISLVISIIVLLILAGISIGMLSGNSSILSNAINAKENIEIQNEKEIVDKSKGEAIGKNRYGMISYEQFKRILDNNSNNNIELEQDDLNFYITFISSQRIYFVKQEGDIEYLGKYSDLTNTAYILANPESDTTPKWTQTVKLTVKTIASKQDDEVFIHYAWTNDENTEPTSYSAVESYTTETPKRRTTEVVSTATAEGDYYLWVKVILDETEVVEKFGPYAIKSHTTLVSTSNENTTSSGFLGSNKFTKSNVVKRSTINSVTILDSLTDLEGVTHTINDSNCWDVSQSQDRSILAWYVVAKDGEDNTIVNGSGATMYDVTIAEKGGVMANANSSYLFYNVGQGGSAVNVISGLENLDTQFTINMDRMFLSCAARNLNIDNWDTKNVISMCRMFNKSKVERLNLNKWDTSNVNTLEGTFEECSNLEVLNVSKWNTSNVTKMGSWGYDYGGTFEDCINLRSLDVSKWNTRKVETMTGMFRQCNNLVQIDVSNFNTEKCRYMNHMFEGCNKLENIDVSSFCTENVEVMDAMFKNSKNLKNLDLSGFVTTSKLKKVNQMFYHCESCENIDISSSFNTDEVTTMASMFEGCKILESIDVSQFNASNVSSLSNMFYGCKKVKSLDVSNFNTGDSLTNTGGMFRECSELASINGLTSFNTKNVDNMTHMFRGCKVSSLDLSSFNTGNVESMVSMFQSCQYLTDLNFNLENFDTGNVKNMNAMFSGCKRLTNLNLTKLDTGRVENMSSMFYFCHALTSLDLSSFNTSNLTNTGSMFTRCDNLTTIYAGDDWDMSNVTNSGGMFNGCTKLVGDISYNSSYIDKTYATTTGGYLTYKAIQNN